MIRKNTPHITILDKFGRSFINGDNKLRHSQITKKTYTEKPDLAKKTYSE